MRIRQARWTFQLALVAALTALVTIQPYAAPVAHGQAIPAVICEMSATEEPRPIGAPGADGWANEQEAMASTADVRRYLFSVKEPATAYVYVGVLKTSDIFALRIWA